MTSNESVTPVAVKHRATLSWIIYCRLKPVTQTLICCLRIFPSCCTINLACAASSLNTLVNDLDSIHVSGRSLLCCPRCINEWALENAVMLQVLSNVYPPISVNIQLLEHLGHISVSYVLMLGRAANEHGELLLAQRVRVVKVMHDKLVKRLGHELCAVKRSEPRLLLQAAALRQAHGRLLARLSRTQAIPAASGQLESWVCGGACEVIAGEAVTLALRLRRPALGRPGLTTCTFTGCRAAGRCSGVSGFAWASTSSTAPRADAGFCGSGVTHSAGLQRLVCLEGCAALTVAVAGAVSDLATDSE
eukprot:6200621-Pleurochrysis_carterae.AAC.1